MEAAKDINEFDECDDIYVNRHRPRHTIWAQDGEWARPYHLWRTIGGSSSSLSDSGRPSTAPCDLSYRKNWFARPYDYPFSYCPTWSQSQRRWSYPHKNVEGSFEDETSQLTSLGRDQFPERSLQLRRTLNHRHGSSGWGQLKHGSRRPNRENACSDFRSSVSRTQSSDGIEFSSRLRNCRPSGDWRVGYRDYRGYCPSPWRRSSSSLNAKHDVHCPAPDHRPPFHHSFLGGHGSYSFPVPSTPRSQNFQTQYLGSTTQTRAYPGVRNRSYSSYSPRRLDSMTCDTNNPTIISVGDEDPYFQPSRGDILLVSPCQTGRMQDHSRQHSGYVRSLQGSNIDFVFRDGDLIVRIGSYTLTPFTSSSYIPYGIVELYGRQGDSWTFLGDAYTNEDLVSKRRNSCIQRLAPYGLCMHTGIGEICNLEPTYGDIIINPDRKMNFCEPKHLKYSMIKFWTPTRLSRLYSHNTILLRPYVRNRNFLWSREKWLGKRVYRVLGTADVRDINGCIEQGIVVKVWPESVVDNQTGYPNPENLGPSRVGVTVDTPGGGCEERVGKYVMWPLTSTFLAHSNQRLSDYQCEDERSSYMDNLWGSIEIYMYSKDPPVGWVYWGSSKHICDTPYPTLPWGIQHYSYVGSF